MIQRLELIYNKIQALSKSNEAKDLTITDLEKELMLLRSEHNNLMGSYELIKNQQETLGNKANLTTLAVETLNKKEIKEKLDKYIEEVDQCIKQLEKL